MLSREIKAEEIMNSGRIKKIDLGVYKVSSQSVKNRFYGVTIDNNNNFGCECADFAFRGPIDCKHIISVRSYMRSSFRVTQKATIGTERPSCCPKCGYWRICGDGVKKVKQGLKQRWLCTKCSYQFVIH